MLSVPIAVGIGWFCDRQFDSEPIGIVIGVVIGFSAMLLRPGEAVGDQDAQDLKDANGAISAKNANEESEDPKPNP